MMPQIRFLSGRAIHNQIRRLLAKPGDAMIAVAFWGSGGVHQTGVGVRIGRTRVLCDLFSGSCNPDEIQVLRAAPRTRVKTIDGMHAKIWCVGDTVIIGSANASANGLGFENKELVGNIEAAVLVCAEDFAQRVRDWFETLWQSNVARQVGGDEVETVRALWAQRRAARQPLRPRTILSAARQPEQDARVQRVTVVAFTCGDSTPEVKRQYRLNGRPVYSEAELRRYDQDASLPFYETGGDWSASPGDVFLEFHIGARGALNYTGLWRVRQENPIPASTADCPSNAIVLLDKINDLEGLELPSAEVKEISKLLRAYAEKTGKQLDGLEVSLLQLTESPRQQKAERRPSRAVAPRG